MNRFLTSLKRSALTLALVGGLAAGTLSETASALAAPRPQITVTGTPNTGVTVRGSNFTPSWFAYVKVIDYGSGTIHDSGLIRTSDPICAGWFMGQNLCFGGGDFTWTDPVMTACPNTVSVIAFDWWTDQSSYGTDASCFAYIL